MDNLYYLDSSYSIIYHNENVIEFRNGGWNVTSHILNDHEQLGILLKVILALQDDKIFTPHEISQKSGVKLAECKEIFHILKEKKLLISANTSGKDKDLFAKMLLNENKENMFLKKIKLISSDLEFKVLLALLKNRFQHIDIESINEHDLFFIMEQGEEIFRDRLALEKIIEKCENIFNDSLVIIFNTSNNPVFYQFLNKILHEAKIPWFFTSIDGPFLYIGPIFSGAFCYECLEDRVLMHTKKNADYLQYKKSILLNKVKFGVTTTDESIKNLVSSLTSMEVGSYLTTGNSIATHKMLSIYLPTMEFSYHKILRLPGCKVCGVDNALQGHQIHFDTGALLEI